MTIELEEQQQLQVLLPAVDLRSNIDQTYSQGDTGSCGPHALVNALDAMYDNAGKSKRFSRAWLYWWAQYHAGHQGSSLGTDLNGLQYAVSQHGLALESQWPWSNVNTPPSETVLGETRVTLTRTLWDINEVKRLLCLGIPVVFAFNVVQSFYALHDKPNWKTHTWDVYGAIGQTDHWVCIVGYDDGAQRFLVENSWGSSWADGGFFGLPYEYFPRVALTAFHVDRIYAFHPKKVQGFMSVPYMLNTTDNQNFTFNNKQNLLDMIAAAESTGDIQKIIDVCVKWKITDKHLEYLRKWDRGSVRLVQESTPQLNWDGFIFASM